MSKVEKLLKSWLLMELNLNISLLMIVSFLGLFLILTNQMEYGWIIGLGYVSCLIWVGVVLFKSFIWKVDLTRNKKGGFFVNE